MAGTTRCAVSLTGLELALAGGSGGAGRQRRVRSAGVVPVASTKPRSSARASSGSCPRRGRRRPSAGQCTRRRARTRSPFTARPPSASTRGRSCVGTFAASSRSARARFPSPRASGVAVCPAAAALLAEAALARGGGGLRGRRRATRDTEGFAQGFDEPLDRELAVSSWLRSSWAIARITGPALRITRAFCAGPSADEASTSKIASTLVSDFCACWPPGPLDREKRRSISDTGIATVLVT